MKIKWKQLLFCIALPLGTGLLSGFLSRESIRSFDAVTPALYPPAWLFPLVWTILYLLMGIASYLVITSDAPQEVILSALKPYGIQLALNFFWTTLFFTLSWYLVAFLWLVALWIFILLTIFRFREISRTAGRLLVPYLLWVSFAGYLNLSIFFLNLG